MSGDVRELSVSDQFFCSISNWCRPIIFMFCILSDVLSSKTVLNILNSWCRLLMWWIIIIIVADRFNKFLLYVGYTADLAKQTKVSVFCKTFSEFSLEYRTIQEKLLQQKEKKASQKERKKTRGKMIVEVRLCDCCSLFNSYLCMYSYDISI